MTFTSTINTFNYFLPPPVDKVHAPPPKVKSWIRHCIYLTQETQCTLTNHTHVMSRTKSTELRKYEIQELVISVSDTSI